MIFKTFIDRDLGHVSFIFGDDNSKEVAIVDPRRDIDEYERYIKENGLIVKYILNTHTHADYIGGHLEIANRYKKAKNIFHKDVPSSFDFIKVKENDTFTLGESLSLKILETPGHTPFCISAIVSEDNEEKYIFIGDILFVGDIARPDLLGDENLDSLTKMSYQSAKKIYALEDSLMMFTSHIKGSFCGKDLKSQYFSTIGIEKKTNYSFSLCQKSEEAYINNLKTQNIETPSFFKKMAGMNISGPKLTKDLSKPKLLNKDNFLEEYSSAEDYIIDFRHPNCFKSGHIAGSLNVYEYSNIVLIVGSLLDNDSGVFLVGDRKTDFYKIVKKLRRIGFDNIVAILDKDVNELDNLIPFDDVISKTHSKKIINLDTTKKIGDINIEISQVRTLELDKSINYEVVCQNGYKSMAVKSYLK